MAEGQSSALRAQDHQPDVARSHRGASSRPLCSHPNRRAEAAPSCGTTASKPLPASVDDLRPGLLVFCARPSFIQLFSGFVGDEWRHAGIVVETNEGLFVSGFGRKDKYALMPLAQLRNYDRVGVGSVFASEREIQAAQDWVSQFDGVAAHYPASSIPAAFLLSFARTRKAGLLRRFIPGLCKVYCAGLSVCHRRRVAFICSTFVCAAVEAARRDPLPLDIRSDKEAVVGGSAVPSSRDTLLERWLATPSDIWRAIPIAQRRLLTAA